MTHRAVPGSLHYVVELPSTPHSAAAARALARAWCQSAGDGRDGTALELLLSEAVTNAVRHAAVSPRDLITVDVVLTTDATVASVSDHGPSFSAVTPAPVDGQTSGFGLHIIAELSRNWAVERHATGNRLTFTL
jgi:anti-sigma regulatory factor (Ser/Thr protein kinase)